VSHIVCVALCAVLCEHGVILCERCVFFCLIIVLLPPGKKPFAVQLNSNNDNNNKFTAGMLSISQLDQLVMFSGFLFSDIMQHPTCVTLPMTWIPVSEFRVFSSLSPFKINSTIFF
jgi:hypothetical protein